MQHFRHQKILVKNFPHGPNNCLFERKENLNNHYTNTECNREIKNESTENTRPKIEEPSRTPWNADSDPPRGASTPGWETLT